MGPGLFIAAIVVAAALFAYLAWLAAKRRREALALVARSMGWQYAADDPFDCTNLAFALFFRGDDQGARNVLWGTTHDGHDARELDFWYEERHNDANGRTSTTRHDFSCLVTDLGSRHWPHLTLEAEGFLRGLRDALGFKDHQTESEEFNRRWKVGCDDARFASTFVDPRLMAFVLDRGDGMHYEVNGSLLLVATERIDPKQVPHLLAHGDALRQVIPRVTWELFSGGAP